MPKANREPTTLQNFSARPVRVSAQATSSDAGPSPGRPLEPFRDRITGSASPYKQLRGLGSPAILQACFAGPSGKS